MRRLGLWCLVVAGWLAVGAPAHAIVLRYAPEPALEATHRVSIAAENICTVEGEAKPVTSHMTVLLTLGTKVLSSDAEGTKVEMGLSGGKITLGSGTMKQTSSLPTGHVVMLVDPSGQATKLLSSDFQTPNGEPALDSRTFSTFVTGDLPAGDVAVGDRWSGEVNIAASGLLPSVQMKGTSQLLALTTYQGRTCAKIRTRAEGPIEADISAMAKAMGAPGMKGTMRGTMRMDETWYYDYEHGVRVGSQATYTGALDMSFTEADGTPHQMATQLKMSQKVALAK